MWEIFKRKDKKEKKEKLWGKASKATSESKVKEFNEAIENSNEESVDSSFDEFFDLPDSEMNMASIDSPEEPDYEAIQEPISESSIKPVEPEPAPIKEEAVKQDSAPVKSEPTIFDKKSVPEEVVSEPEINATFEGDAAIIVDTESEEASQNEKPAKKKQGLFAKLKEGLKKTRDTLLGSMFVETGEKIDDDFYDELEEAMIISDMGMATTEKLLKKLRSELKTNGINTRTEAKQVMIRLLTEAMQPESEFLPNADKAVIMIVGVNGVGKTTSIGKLASMYKAEGKSVMLAAADTFRAAAAEQLTVWAERADVPIIKHCEGADPAAVVFDAIAAYRARKSDYLICDTAGRLHNKVNLMNELAKMRRIIDRELPNTPVEVLLVLDATTGQNAIAQAKVFGENAGLTGIILTKLDGTAKGGVVVAVKDELHLPVRYVGVGEGIDDLQPFDAEAFANALL